MNDVTIIKYIKRNGREYGTYLVNDIIIIQNENEYKAIIHKIDKPIEECLEYVTDIIVNKIKETVGDYYGENK